PERADGRRGRRRVRPVARADGRRTARSRRYAAARPQARNRAADLGWRRAHLRPVRPVQVPPDEAARRLAASAAPARVSRLAGPGRLPRSVRLLALHAERPALRRAARLRRAGRGGLVSSATPTGIGVRMYQVGFGDCFVLSFHYDAPLDDGRDVRHVLFDFGSTRWPKLHEGRYVDIADDIAAHTAGKLDALVITHRHKDHLGGFGNKQAAAKLALLQPKAVVRPWTENPTAAAGATGPAFVGERSFRYVRSLDQAQAFAEVIASSIDQEERGFRGDLRDVAEEQLKNRSA